MIKPALGCKG